MKPLLLFLIVVNIFPGLSKVMAQETPKKDISNNISDNKNKTNEENNKSKADQLHENINDKIDHAQSKVNQLTNPDLKSLLAKAKAKRDSSQADSVKRETQKLDSLKGDLAHKLDSIRALPHPKDKLDHLTDSIKQASPYKHIQETEAKLNELKQKINQPIDKAENTVNEKLAQINQAGGKEANLPGNIPGADTKNLNISGVQDKLDITKELNVKDQLPQIDNPIKDQLGEVKELKNKASELQNLPQEQLSKVTSIDQVQNAKESLGKVNQLTDQAQNYTTDAKNLAQGKIGEMKELPQTLENQATQLNEVKEFQKQSGAFGQYAGLTDQDKAKQMLMQQAKQQVMLEAKNHFAGKEQVLQQAMEKMSKLKRKYSELKSLNDSLKQSANSLKGKPFIERIIPGITLQVQKGDPWQIDYNPWIAYRLNKRYTLGAGWNERIGITSQRNIITGNRIYGPRAFVELSIKKGLSVKTEVEKMNTAITGPTTFRNIEPGDRVWVWSWFVGVKKQYKITKSVKGNFQFLYNLYDDHYSSPYTKRYNIRFGFEFPIKKRIQKTK